MHMGSLLLDTKRRQSLQKILRNPGHGQALRRTQPNPMIAASDHRKPQTNG